MESTESETADKTQRTDLGEVLHEAGLDKTFWTKVLKDEKGVDRSEQLQYLSVSDYEEIKRHVRHEWEERALQKVLGIQRPDGALASENEKIKRNKRHTEKHSQEQEKIKQVKKNLEELKKIHQEGFDQNDATVKKKLDEISSALEVPGGSWWEFNKPLQDIIQALYERLCSIEEGLNSPVETISDEEVLRSASGGLALAGIYQTGKLEDLLQKRQRLLEVPESVRFHGPEHKYFYDKKEFYSWESQTEFQKVIEKLGVSFSISLKSGALGVKLDGKNENGKSEETRKKSRSEHTHIINTQYNYVPMASCFIEKEKLMICDSALKELKKLETIWLNVNEKKTPELLKEVDCFFQTFGSHVNQGPLHFGGIFWWTASAEGFNGSELTEAKSVTSMALNAHVGIGSFFGVSGGMIPSLSQCGGSFEGKYSASLLSKVQLSVSKSGGPPETDNHLNWKSGLVTSNKSWRVIDRGDTLVPIWEIMLSSHSKDFKDVSKLSNFLMEAYTAITKQEARSLWGEDVLSAVEEAQKMIQSVKMWSVSHSEKHLRKLLEIKRKLEDKAATKTWVQECLANRAFQDFLTDITNQNTDLNLKVMMKSIMDQSSDVEDFPNCAEILQWTELPEDDLPEVTSALNFSDFVKILTDIQDDFDNQGKSGMSQEKATCTITTAINSLRPRLRDNGEKDIELLILSIVNVFGYREDTFCPLLGQDEIAFLLSTLNQRYADYSSLKEKSEEKAEAFLLLTALTVSNNQKISPEHKEKRLKLFTSRAGNIFCLSRLMTDTENCKDWNKLEQKLDMIINETSLTKEQEGLLKKIQTLDQIQKPSIQKNHPSQYHTTGTEPPPIDECKEGKFKALLQRLGLWESYPAKIKMEDVLLIRNMSRINQNTEGNSLYQQYIYKLMMLDCSARYLCLKAPESAEPESSSAADASDSDEEYYCPRKDTLCAEVCENDSSVHPMDIHMAVFHCCDDFVRQYLLSKLSTCQFALPLLIPNPITSEIIFPAWALRQIRKTWKNKQRLIFNAQVPTVSFVRLGASSNSKSHILSNIISQRKHPVFFNRHCAGSMKQCLLMDGVVEITWYCAGSKKGNIFEDCVAFVNLHGDASHHPRQLQFLQEVSTATVLLLSESPLEEEARKTLKQLRDSSTPLITLISNAESIQGKSKKNVKIAVKNRNEAELTSEIISSIKQCLSLKSERKSLAACLDTARQNQFKIDEDTDQCSEAKAQAQHLENLLRGEQIKDGNKVELMNFKDKHLPLQGGLWESWCKKDKEQYRLHSTGEKSNEMILSEIKSEKRLIRIEQLNKALPLSDFMNSFIQYLRHSEENKAFYMLQWLQEFVEENTSGPNAILQDKYHSIWTEMKNKTRGEEKELEKKLEEVIEEINKMSVGLQHLMRELSQLYEAVKSVAESENFTEIQCQYIYTLPRIGAKMLMAGYPLELMDGDVAHVALDWLKAVFDDLIEKLGDKKVFVLSVLGLQSSGKSTLLNTMFGLQFPVSAGRCTRGAFMQLLTVDEEMREELQFDFVLVVDTEGLRSPELSSEATLARDNQLATFIIGVGNLTVINIMGENPCEMQDILQICIQAFMRMTLVKKIMTSCIFVHQNVADMTANEKNKEGRRRLQKRLDEMTRIAAKEEHLDIESFSDIIHFDVENQVFYFKNLLEGDPPMAPPNPSYSQNVQVLKDKLLSITKWQPDCHLPSLSEVKQRIQDVWDALLKENFVFSFKNTLELSIYSKLEKSYGQWTWEIRKHALESQQTWCNKINSNLVNDVHRSGLLQDFDEIYTQLKEKIEKYFTCEEHPEILVNWRNNIDTRLAMLKDQLIDDTLRKCRNELNIRKCRADLDGKKIGYEAELLRRSRALASKIQDQKHNEEQMRSHFDEMWTKWLTKISAEKRQENQVNIQAIVEGILFNQFRMEKNIRNTIQKHKTMTEFHFQVDKYVPLGWSQMLMEKLPGLGNADFRREGYRLTHEIIDDVQKYIDEKSNNHVDFNEIFIHQILEFISQALSKYEEEKIVTHVKLQPKYKVDLSIFTCMKAVEKFSKMHDDFNRKNDPLTCLSEKKEEYFKYFEDSCNGATSVAKFANFLCHHLKSEIKKQMYAKVSRQISNDMKCDHPTFSGNRANLEDHILKELAEKQDFGCYVEYLEHPKQHFQKFIERKVQEYCKKKGLISNLLNKSLKSLVEKTLTESSIVTSVLKEKKNGNISEWITIFSDKLGSVIPINTGDFQNLEKEGTGNLELLPFIIAKSLSDMQDKVTQEINTSSLDFKMFEKSPDKFLFEQFRGCWECCPFCKAICTNTIPNHDTDHSVAFHRPQCVGGWRWSRVIEAVIEFCTTFVGSDQSFHNNEMKSIPYKEYRNAGPAFKQWSIKPDSSEKVYWKWFVWVFRDKLQERDGYKFEGRGEIPENWKNITKDAVLKELDGGK